MSYSLWHCGVRIGEAELERNPDVSRHLAGVFHPTAYGRRVLPRLTGLLTVAASLKSELKARGLSEVAIRRGGGIAALMDSTAAGRDSRRVARALSEVELRDPAGVPLTLRSIAFVDLVELRSVAARIGCKSAVSSLATVPPDTSLVLVSATLDESRSAGSAARRIEIT